MGKIHILYRNELYKIFRTVKMLIVLILLLVVPFGITAIGRASAVQTVVDDAGPVEATADYGNRMQRERTENRLAWLEDMEAHGAISNAEKVLKVAAEKALEDFDKLQAEDPAFSGRFYISDLLSNRALSDVIMHPEQYEVPEDFQTDRVFDISSEYQQLIYEGDWQIPPSSLEELKAYQALWDRALSSGRFEDFAEIRMKRLEAQQEEYPSLSIQVELEIYRELSEHPNLSDAELYIPGVLDGRIQKRARIERMERQLESGRSELVEYGPLLPSERQALIDELAVLRAKSEENDEFMPGRPAYFHQLTAKEAFSIIWLILTFLLLVFVGIQAGSMVSQEIESGSIKLLIIAPVKRWKMYVAKLLALWTTVMALTLFAFVTTQAAMHLVLSASALKDQEIIGAVFGKVYRFTLLEHTALDALNLLLRLIFHSTLIMMISSLLRKSSITVGLGIGVSLVDFFATIIYYNTGWKFWYKWMPWVNLDMMNIRYSTALGDMFHFGFYTKSAYVHNMGFAAVYIVLFVALFFWAGLDAFTKRDI